MPFENVSDIVTGVVLFLTVSVLGLFPTHTSVILVTLSHAYIFESTQFDFMDFNFSQTAASWSDIFIA